jgi:hypothetical protein
MGSKAQAKASSENAKRMKDLGIRRRTGSCPMSCGAQVPIGGTALLAHLGRCVGKRR